MGPDGTRLYANRTFHEYTGIKPEEVNSDSFHAEKVHPDDLERLNNERQTGLERREPFEIESRVRGKDGRYRWFLVRYNRSATNRDASFAGMQRERILTTANAARNGRKMKISCYEKKSNALRCSKRSLARPKHYVKCWRKCRKWLPLILQS